MRYSAVVLAADRKGEENRVARAAGVPAKVLAEVGGVPMLFRVLEALSKSRHIEKLLLVANPPVLEAAKERFPVEGIEPAPSITASVERAFAALSPFEPVLVTTGDNALLGTETVDHFLKGVPRGADLAIGLVRYLELKARYPEARRTVIRLADGPFCGCNLYAFLTPRGREVVRLWRGVEQERKRPWKLVGHFDLKGLLLYLSGRLSSAEARARIRERLGVDAAFVLLKEVEVAIDVDTPEDLLLADRIARSSASSSSRSASERFSRKLP